jgi:hypothetical protein
MAAVTATMQTGEPFLRLAGMLFTHREASIHCMHCHLVSSEDWSCIAMIWTCAFYWNWTHTQGEHSFCGIFSMGPRAPIIVVVLLWFWKSVFFQTHPIHELYWHVSLCVQYRNVFFESSMSQVPRLTYYTNNVRRGLKFPTLPPPSPKWWWPGPDEKKFYGHYNTLSSDT